MWAEFGHEIGLTVSVMYPCYASYQFINLSDEMFCISEASLQYWRIPAYQKIDMCHILINRFVESRCEAVAKARLTKVSASKIISVKEHWTISKIACYNSFSIFRGWDSCMAAMSSTRMYPWEYKLQWLPFTNPHR